MFDYLDFEIRSLLMELEDEVNELLGDTFHIKVENSILRPYLYKKEKDEIRKVKDELQDYCVFTDNIYNGMLSEIIYTVGLKVIKCYRYLPCVLYGKMADDNYSPYDAFVDYIEFTKNKKAFEIINFFDDFCCDVYR